MGCIQLESEIISLLFFQQHDALPVIVAVPEEKQKEDFLLAYSCMPAALTDIAKIKDKKVVLFTKARERNLPAHRPLRTASLPSPRTPSAGGREVDRVLQAVPEHRDQKGGPRVRRLPLALLGAHRVAQPRRRHAGALRRHAVLPDLPSGPPGAAVQRGLLLQVLYGRHQPGADRADGVGERGQARRQEPRAAGQVGARVAAAVRRAG